MVETLSLTQFACARVWMGEEPLDRFPADGALTKTIRAGIVRPRQSVAVEAFVPRGGRALYGLLGIELVAGDAVDTEVRVPFSTDAGSRWAHALAAKDVVECGLPREYAADTLLALSTSLEGRCAAASVVVTHAAHSPVGSSPEMFARLARACAELALASRWDAAENTRALRELLL